MRKLKSSMVSYDKFCSMLKERIFNYDKMSVEEILRGYDALLDSAEEVDIDVEKNLKNIPTNPKDDDTSLEYEDHFQEIILFGTEIAISNIYGGKTVKDDFCLKTKVKGTAVQMRNNSDLLGFVSDFTDNDRFLMVDFGDAEGPVKTDVDELIFG